MSKPLKIKLSVPKPWAQDWDKMIPDQIGRHYNQCSKTVVDFSKFIDKELLEYLSKTKNEICGVFGNSQLEQLIVVNQPTNARAFRKVLFTTAFAAGMSIMVEGQNNTTPEMMRPIVAPNTPMYTSDKYKPLNDSICKVSGMVIDSATRQVLPFANVLLNWEDKQIAGITTDADGKFEIPLNKDLAGKKLTIKTIYVGYYDNKVNFIFDNFPFNLGTIKVVGDPNYIYQKHIGDYRRPIISKDTK